MAKANPELIAAMRRAADAIEKKKNYQWGHMGHCNCGHLAQELSELSPAEIHKIAMQRSGDWNDQCEDYCSTSNMPIDILISELLTKGLSIEDLMNLEKLADSKVVASMKAEFGYLEKNNPQHVCGYLRHWAAILEEEYLKDEKVPNLLTSEPELEMLIN